MREYEYLRGIFSTAAVWVLAFASGDVAASAPLSCDDIASLRVDRTTLEVARGSTTEACHIAGVIRPNERSRIGFELWLPRNHWNGRLTMLGNGGYSSALPRQEMELHVKEGYAVVATDTGHAGEGPEFAIDHPEAIVDWGSRAVHLTAVRAKEIVAAFYEQPARYSYFYGCSTGGHQAFMEAQRFPEDFDGILAGAPGHNRTHLNAGFLWQFRANRTPADATRPLLSASQLVWVTKALLAACGKQNGGTAGGLATDTWLNDPLACDFDPGVLECTVGGGSDCLTPEQVDALKRMYAGAHNPRTHARIYFGWPPGSESSADGRSGWHLYWSDPTDRRLPARAAFWRYWVFSDERWDGQRFDFDRDMERTDRALAPLINAMSPDLEPFRRRGGKLIHYHGLGDPVVPFADSISYRQRVVRSQKRARRLGSVDVAQRATSEFYRLFLAPGLGHCQGGPGPAPVGLQQALEDWVERGRAPDTLLAARNSGGVDGAAFTRPLCAYPAIARYEGKGDPNAAASFTCAAPERAPAVPELASPYLK